MVFRFFPSALGLRLKPRGELFVSLLAIGLAVALPAMAWVWTTVRTLDRDRRDRSQELQALHRFRLEEAIRTLEVALKARASRAGHRTPSRVSEAGVLFRDVGCPLDSLITTAQAVLKALPSKPTKRSISTNSVEESSVAPA